MNCYNYHTQKHDEHCRCFKTNMWIYDLKNADFTTKPFGIWPWVTCIYTIKYSKTGISTVKTTYWFHFTTKHGVVRWQSQHTVRFKFQRFFGSIIKVGRQPTIKVISDIIGVDIHSVHMFFIASPLKEHQRITVNLYQQLRNRVSIQHVDVS